jgi:hypothetical protein
MVASPPAGDGLLTLPPSDDGDLLACNRRRATVPMTHRRSSSSPRRYSTGDVMSRRCPSVQTAVRLAPGNADAHNSLGYSLQANQKRREGTQHPDRDAQFRYINDQARRFHRKKQPVISVYTKKKELVGDFKNAGREWRPKGDPEVVRVHDFLIPEQAKPFPTSSTICNATKAG